MTWTFYNAQGQEKLSAIRTNDSQFYRGHLAIGAGTPQGIPNTGVWTDVTAWALESYDLPNGDQWPGSGGTVTIRKDGLYSFAAQIEWTAMTGSNVNQRGVRFNINGGIHGQALDDTLGNVSFPLRQNVMCRRYCTAGETFTLQVWQNSTTTPLNIAGYQTWMAWERLDAMAEQGPQGAKGDTGATVIPMSATLPASPTEGQQVIWYPTVAGSATIPYWHMIYTGGMWRYIAGEPAVTPPLGAYTYVPATSTIGKANPQDKYPGTQQLTFPANGQYHIRTSPVSVRSGASNPAAAGIVGLGIAYNWDSTVLLVSNGRIASYIFGVTDGLTLGVEVYATSMVAGDKCGVIVQGGALTAGQGWIYDEAATARMFMTPVGVS